MLLRGRSNPRRALAPSIRSGGSAFDNRASEADDAQGGRNDLAPSAQWEEEKGRGHAAQDAGVRGTTVFADFAQIDVLPTVAGVVPNLNPGSYAVHCQLLELSEPHG